jgi:TP901 family phage tail tape measure protein
MATLQQVVQLVFEGVDQASDTTKKVGSALQELDGKVSKLAAPFADLADKILKLDAVLIGAAVTIGVLSVREAARFETSLVDLNKVLGESEGQASDYAGTLKELALTYGVNANELVLSAADFRRSGNDIETSIALVKQSLDLMLAGGVSAAEATEILKNSMQGFGIPASEVIEASQKISDILNFVADNSASSFNELSTGFKDLAPVAKLTGLSFEEIAAAIAVVIGAGNSGAETATALKTTFLRLATATGESADAMKALGVEFDSAGKPIGSIKDIIEAIAPSWAKLTDEQKLQNAEMLAGKNQATKFIALMDSFAQAQDLAALAVDKASGSVERQVNIVLAAAEVQFGRTTEAVRQLAQTIGDNLLIASAGAAGGVTDMATAFQRLIEGGKLDPFFALINKELERLGVTFRDVAKNLPEAFEQVDLSGFLKALEGVGAEVRGLFRELFGEIDVSTPEGLANVIQRIVDGFTLLTRVTEGIISQFRPLFAAIRESIDNFNQLDDASQIEFGQFLGAMKLLTDLGPKVGAALLLIAETTLDMKTVINAGFGAITIAVNAFQVAFDGVAYAIVQGARGIGAYALALAELDAYLNRNSESAQEYRDRADRLRETLDDLGLVAGAIGENFKRNAEELRAGWNKAIGEADEKSEATRGTLDRTKAALLEFGKATEDSGTAARESVKDYDGILAVLSRIEPTVEDTAASMGSLADASKEANKEFSGIEWGKVADNADALADNIKRTDGVLIEAGKSAAGYAASLEGVSTEYKQVGDGTVKATGAFAEVKDKTNDAAKALDELIASGQLTTKEFIEVTKNANDFKVKMEEIASDERIKTIEASVTLNVARLEADVERVKATFASIDNTINSTGDLLGNLFGLLGDASTFDKLNIQSQIDLENKRRQEALDIQKELAKAEIARIEAQTRQLDRGDPWIRIDGTGLAPQLEAFMWEILKATRTQVSAEFGNFLLGVAP